jgi:hypothetical protein
MTHFQLSTMSQIDFTRAHLHVRRLKGGIASVHPIQGDELRALRELRRQTEGAPPNPPSSPPASLVSVGGCEPALAVWHGGGVIQSD